MEFGAALSKDDHDRDESIASEVINAQLAQPVTAASFIYDINISGAISLADKAIGNASLVHALPAP